MVLVGGGTGGHVTPLLALGREIKKKHPNWQLHYLGARSDAVGANLTKGVDFYKSRHFITAGKWHRFGKVRKRQLFYFWLPSFWLNFYNLFLVKIGIIQSFFYLKRIKPDLIFSKGGYVAFGPCLMARLLKIPLVIHDSDVVGGLAHALVKNYATMRLTGFLTDAKARNVRHVGIPVNPVLGQTLSASKKKALWQKYNLPARAQVILVTGGGGGAHRLNLAVLRVFDELKLKTNTHLIVAAGQRYYPQAASAAEKLTHKNRVQVFDFIYDMPDLLRGSLGVVTRAGATILTETSLAGKPIIIVPNALLPQAHQVHNGRLYQRAQAGWLVSDDGAKINTRALKRALNELINDRSKRLKHQKNIKGLASTRATAQTLKILEEVLMPGRGKDQYRHYKRLQEERLLKKQVEQRRSSRRYWQKKVLKFLQYSLPALLVLAVIYKLTYIDNLEIRFSEASRLLKTEERIALQRDLNDFFYKEQSLFKRHFHLDTGYLTELLAERDYVAESQIERSLLDSSLIITIEPRQVFGVAKMADGQRRILTTDGYAIGGYGDLLAETAAGLEVESYYPSSNKRQLILSPLDLSFIESTNLYLGSQGYKLQKVALSPNLNEIFFYIKGYEFKVIALKTEDPVKQAISLGLALDFFKNPYLREDLLIERGLEIEGLTDDEEGLEEITPAEYVDVRLVERVYYK